MLVAVRVPREYVEIPRHLGEHSATVLGAAALRGDPGHSQIWPSDASRPDRFSFQSTLYP